MKLKVGSKKALVFIVLFGLILGVMVGAILINMKKAAADKNYMDLQKQKLDVENRINSGDTNIVNNNELDDEKDNEQIEDESNRPIKESEDLVVVPTILDEIKNDSAYCPTFQIVWNELSDYFCGGKTVEMLNGTNTLIDNLNERTFEKTDLSDDYYYVKVGKQVLSVKKEIEDGIKDKFNETSDILNMVEWVDDSGENFDIDAYEAYVFYSMLKREFTFNEPFDVIDENGTFNDFKNVKYFGINSDSDNKLRNQVNVLFYEDYDNHSVLLNTKQGDEVILLKTSDDSFKNFDEVYKYLENKTNKFDGEKEFTEDDTLKVPNIKFDVLKKYNELIGKTFNSDDGKSREISEALQTIRFEIDNEGGKIKSEAIIAVKTSAIIAPEEKRHFNYNDTFYLMLREKGKDKPYFMVKVDNMNLFQENAEKMD